MGLEWLDYWSGGKFIIGISMERVLGKEVAHTGGSAMGGQLLCINLNAQNLQSGAATVHVVCHFDAVLSITSGGAEIVY